MAHMFLVFSLCGVGGASWGLVGSNTEALAHVPRHSGETHASTGAQDPLTSCVSVNGQLAGLASKEQETWVRHNMHGICDSET